MSITVCDMNMCNACMACSDKCPKKAISIKDSVYAFNAIIDEKLCIHCGICEKICPQINEVQLKKPISWYEGWADEKIRNNSSSGGAASAIIETFIKQGGWVASCIFKDGNFVFEITDDLCKAKKFAGSKYVKSNPKGIYEVINEKLKKGSKCLFIGLPCQVAALTNYVNYHPNLFTIDLICHGTPSPQILNSFLREKKINIYSIKDISFRSKTCFEIMLNQKRIVPSGVKDMYTYAFLSSLDYTNNCYSCRYATLGRVADITLGDSWGSEVELKEQKKGISLILCQTEKGKKLLFDSCLVLKDVDLDKAMKTNHQLAYPSIMPEKREVFFEYFKTKGFHQSISRCYPKIYYKQKIKEKLIKMKILQSPGVL